MFSDIYTRLLRNIIAQDVNQHAVVNKLDSRLDRDLGRSSAGEFSFLIQSAYAANPDTDIGLVFGKQITPVHACEFSRMLTTAYSVEQLISTLVRQYHRLGLKPYPMFFQDRRHAYIALTYPYSSLSLPPDSNPVDVNRDGARQKRNLNRFCSETFFAYLINVIRDLVDADFSPEYLALDYAAPRYGKRYQRFFNCPIEFDSGLTLMKFNKDILKSSLRHSSEQLHSVYLERFSDGWQGQKRYQSYRYRAVTEMMCHAPECFQIAQLAQRLNISVRGLQKRLKSENSSFSELTSQVRKELLKICLVRADMTLEDSAKLLGFQTLVSFKRYFKDSLALKTKACRSLS